MSDSGQLQPEETLDDRGVDDVLDEGISPPEKPRGVTAHGVTPLEEEQGETLEQRLAQEEPEDSPQDLGRSGRLVAPDEGRFEDHEHAMVARDVGIDGGAASAEEAAVHEIPELGDPEVEEES